MASPPFNIAEATPGDSDIVSQFPAAERTFRDVVEDWISVEHDTSGLHKSLSLSHVATPTGTASYTTIWADTTGAIRARVGTGTVAWLVPPGTVTDYAGTTEPEGWLFCYGQAISRSTYAALFTAIGTTYGSGDGSTTFNLPDCRGRVVAGQDDMGGSSANRLTNQTGGLDGDTLGATGGSETHTLTEAQLASHSHGSGSYETESHGHSDSFALSNATGVARNISESKTTVDQPGGASVVDDISWTTSTISVTGSVTSAGSLDVSGTSSSAGSGTAHNNVQPTIILNKIIKI